MRKFKYNLKICNLLASIIVHFHLLNFINIHIHLRVSDTWCKGIQKSEDIY